MKRLSSFIIVFFGLYLNSFAQDMLPFVENITKANYDGDNQVWNVTQGNDNAMYFANNHFFLRYNGVKWEKYSLPHKTIIRSVFADNDRIYSGSYNELGYWKRIEGKMKYFSLSNKKMFFGESVNEEIWKIVKFDDKIFFQSFNQIFIYDGKTVKKLSLPSQISYCFNVNNQFLIATVNNGIYKLENNQFKKLFSSSLLDNCIVHSIEFRNNKTYIFSRNNGVFIVEDGIVKPWNNQLNNSLKSELINTAKFIDSNRLAIGTAFKGIYVVDVSSNAYININRNNALKNNSVLSIGFDKENDLWLGMDNGIVHIEINSPFKLFVDNTGLLGTIYSVATLNEGYLLGSNHGLFKYENKELTFLNGSQGQVWQIDKINNNYIIGHNDGTFLYNSSLKKINDVNGGWKILKNNYNQTYFQANYTGICIYADDTFNDFKKVGNLTKPIRDIAQNTKNELWAVDNYKSLYKIEFDSNQKEKKVINFTEQNGINNDFNVKLFSFKNDILFYINGVWYKNNSITNKLEIFSQFNNVFRGISNISKIDEDNFLIIKDGLFYIINFKSNNFIWNLIPKRYYEGKSVKDDTKVLKQGNKIVVNLDDGFFVYDLNEYQKVNKDILIEGFYNSKIINKGTKINFNQSVNLEVITPFYGFKKLNIYYKSNESSNLLPVIDGKVTLNNLLSGKHFVNFYIIEDNGFKKIKSFEFYVSKPWYFSNLMILGYLLFLSLGLYLYYRWNKMKYLQKIRLNEEELRHRQEVYQLELETENKLKLQEYEKHILEAEIKNKASEVTGKSLSIAKQTEMIEVIEKHLDTENSIDALKNKIRKSIKINSINKKEWKAFESSLFNSHDDFVKIITNKYANLTPKDIKLCIYLKMNLTSKEIAPLMNISYRGVELHRYRLRKKLNLNKDINLSNYLSSL